METLQRTANRGSISTGFDIDNSLKFEADNTEYLTRDPASSGDRQKFTTSMWVKRTELGQASTIFGVQPASGGLDTNTFQFGFMSDDKFQLGLQTYYVFNTNRLFRDTSAWYHIVMAVDTTQATASNRIKLYINGIQETSFDVETYPNQNHTTGVNFTEPHRIGTLITNSWYFSGYIAEVNHVDGSQLAPTDFGEYDADSGIWKPKAYAGSFGTNGFYLDFKDSANLGNDASGGLDFTETNIAAADQATDTPTNNFCTWNPLWVYASQPVISEGATKVRIGDSTNEGAKATIGLTNGKWYWEAKPVGTIGGQQIGIQTDGDSNIASDANSTANNYGMWINAIGYYYTYADSQTESADQGWDLTASDWLGIALDMDSGTQTIKFYKNGSLIQSLDLISDMQGRTVFPFLMNYENRSFDINFGGYTINTISSAATDENGYGTFEYAPPSGYYAICTKNLAEYG